MNTQDLVSEALRDLFASSPYLHSVGTGDEQAIEDILRQDFEFTFDGEDIAAAFIAGALVARAMTTNYEGAGEWGRKIVASLWDEDAHAYVPLDTRRETTWST